MIPELGHLALILALCLALLQASLPLAGTLRPARRQWMALAKPAAAGQFAMLLLAFTCLAQSFATLDFSVAYVAANSNTQLPLFYRLAAVWGAHEGSMLLWVLMLAGWGAAVALFSRQLPQAMAARVLAVMGMLGSGLLGFILFTSNPFVRLINAPAEGRDLNPLLQDPGMIAHPPLLYMGYVGFSVAFAFAIAALIGGRLDTAWARWSRPWTLVAWSFLTLGIAMGSFWAYYELGWGGWWFWDAVENASFMPWLAGTALLHSLAVTEKRGILRGWTVLLAIVTFALSLLGTFLVRSGVLTSVHAFASDPQRGSFILAYLALVVGASLLLYGLRLPALRQGDSHALVSRESLLLSNNVLLATATGTVLLGTLYPLVLDALALGKISVGPPYFEAVFQPLGWLLLLLLALAPWLPWKESSAAGIARSLRASAAASIAVGVVALVAGMPAATALSLGLAAWILLAMLAWCRGRAGRFLRLPASTHGMLLAHAGIAVFVVGVAMVKTFEVERELPMRPGDSTTLAGRELHFLTLEPVQGPNYIGTAAHFALLEDGQVVAMLKPEKRLYASQDNPMTEAAIDRSFTRDIYVALGDPLGNQAWSVRLQEKPFVNWIWSACLMMAAGGFLCLGDRRYRLARQARTQGQVAMP